MIDGIILCHYTGGQLSVATDSGTYLLPGGISGSIDGDLGLPRVQPRTDPVFILLKLANCCISMKVVTIISYPRTGSSLLIHQARSLPLCALLEIFHPDESVAREHLVNNPYGSCFTDLSHQYVRNDVIGNVSTFLERLIERSPSDVLVFKVFPGHLPPAALECLIAQSSAILIHTRNRLHSYISNTIAGQLKSWGGINTSHSSILFQHEDFLRYLAVVQEFLSVSMTYAVDHSTPILFSSFERLSENDDSEVQLRHVAQIFSHVTGRLLEPLLTSRDLPRRQDGRSLAIDKVSNPAELNEFLEMTNAQCLNDSSRDILNSDYVRIISKGR